MSPYWFILTVLAVWRLVVFIRQDALIEGTRTKVLTFLARRHGKLWADKLAYLLDCPWCLSIWLGGFAVVAWELLDVDFTLMEGIVTWLAIAAVVPTLDILSEKL